MSVVGMGQSPRGEEPWCVFVSGSRDLTREHEPLITDKLRLFQGPYATLIHGMGEGRTPAILGCDRLADQVAFKLGFHIIACPALWRIQNKRAGPIRNRLCAEILFSHGPAGFQLAMLGFSTGGPGTEGALTIVRQMVERKSYPVQIERVEVRL